MKQNIKKIVLRIILFWVIKDVTQMKKVIHVLEFALDSKTKVTSVGTLARWTVGVMFAFHCFYYWQFNKKNSLKPILGFIIKPENYSPANQKRKNFDKR